MENAFEKVMEKIEKEDKLPELLKIKNIKELWNFLKENGYSKSESELKKEIEMLLEEISTNLEDSELSQVAGGTLKDSITKLTSAGMASLLMLGASPVHSQAHEVGNPNYFTNIAHEPASKTSKTSKLDTKKFILATLGISALGAAAEIGGLGVYSLYKYKQKDKLKNQIDKNNETPKKTLSKEEFIQKHFCNSSFSNPECKEILYCLTKKIINTLGLTDEKRISDYYPTHEINRIPRDDEREDLYRYFDYLCHVVNSYLWGDSSHHLSTYGFEISTYAVLFSPPKTTLNHLILSCALAKGCDNVKFNKVRKCIDYLRESVDQIHDFLPQYNNIVRKKDDDNGVLSNDFIDTLQKSNIQDGTIFRATHQTDNMNFYDELSNFYNLLKELQEIYNTDDLSNIEIFINRGLDRDSENNNVRSLRQLLTYMARYSNILKDVPIEITAWDGKTEWRLRVQ